MITKGKKLCNPRTYIGTVTVRSAGYTVHYSGAINFKVIAGMDKFRKNFIPVKSKVIREKHFFTDHVGPGDVFNIYLAKDGDHDYELWDPIEQLNHPVSINPHTAPTHCPYCREPITVGDAGWFCVNDQCTARLWAVTEYFLSFLNIDWDMTRIAEAIPYMIQRKFITKISDLYNLTFEDLIGCQLDVDEAGYFLNWLHTKKNCATYVQFIKFLVHFAGVYQRSMQLEIEDLVLNDENILTDFSTVQDFITWWRTESNKSNPDISRYMSEGYFVLITRYLNLPQNVENLISLEKQSVFKNPWKK